MPRNMRLEQIPLVIGAIIALAGLALVLDAATPDAAVAAGERRRRERPERSRPGELVLGLAIVLCGAVFIGRDSWRYSTLAASVAIVLFVVGIALNWRYVRGLTFGPAVGRVFHRRESDALPPVQEAPPPDPSAPPTGSP